SVARRGPVTLVRTKISSAELDALAAEGVAVFAGPSTNLAVLRAAGVKAANRIVALGASDGENVGVAAAVRRLRRHKDAGDVLVRVENAALRARLSLHGDLRAADIFSLAEVAARLVTISADFVHEASALKQPRVHIGIVGWSDVAAATIARVFRTMWAPGLE